MDVTDQHARLVAPRCGFTGSCLRNSVSESGTKRKPSRWRVRAILLVQVVFLAAAEADWIRWESGFRAASGKAVISTDSNPATDGVPNLYHSHRVNFEAVVDWRKGDTLETEPGEPRQWVYTVTEDSNQPLSITIRLSHVVGYEFLQLVDETGPPIVARVFMGDLIEPGEGAASLAYQMQLFRDGRELSYSDDPDGIDYPDAPAMTFHADPQIPLLVGSERASPAISPNEAKATPDGEAESPTHLCVAAFGFGAPAWDQVVLTFADNTGDGIIRAGTQMRVVMSGIPLALSSHRVPCTSDPIPPLVFYDTDAALTFDVTGISSAGVGIMKLRDPGAGSLIDALPDRLPLESSVRVRMKLSDVRTVPSDSFMNVVLESDGYFNNQATLVLATNEFSARPLAKILEGAWGRNPAPWVSAKPAGRPLWESSMSLCEIEHTQGTFYARHLNARRIVFGTLANSSDPPVPAFWRQHADAPTALSTGAGQIEGANDSLLWTASGHTIIGNGSRRPTIWVEVSGGKWAESLLPVPAFCVDGNALGVSDVGVACGYVEIQATAKPNRLPCLWVPDSAGSYPSVSILPTPEEARSGVAVDINRTGIVVGYTENRSGLKRACRWNPIESGWVWEDLGAVGVAASINWLGTIVGGDGGAACMWQGDERIDLNAAMERSGGPQLDRVIAIGELGDLIGVSDGAGTLFEPVMTLEF